MNDISSESQFLFFDKALTGHTCNLVWIQGTRRIVIQGGFNGESYSNYIYELETESFLWTQIDIRGKGEHPAPRNFHTSNYDQSNNLIVYYGGWDGNIFNQNQESFRNPWVFHLRNFSWEMINVNREDKLLPCRRGHTSELWRENRLLVFGGIRGFNKYLNELVEINLEIKDFNIIRNISGSIPTPRAFHSSCMYKQKMIIYGGILQNNEVTNEIYVYDCTNSQFSFIKQSNIPCLYGHKSKLIGGKIIIVGGSKTGLNQNQLKKEDFFKDQNAKKDLIESLFIITIN